MTYFTLLFIYFITVNKYRFCISVIGYINVQIIGIGFGNKKKINIGRSLIQSAFRLYIFTASMCVSLELNPQTFALLTQWSTTEPQEQEG